jgi:hypothetical protein
MGKEKVMWNDLMYAYKSENFVRTFLSGKGPVYVWQAEWTSFMGRQEQRPYQK